MAYFIENDFQKKVFGGNLHCFNAKTFIVLIDLYVCTNEMYDIFCLKPVECGFTCLFLKELLVKMA